MLCGAKQRAVIDKQIVDGALDAARGIHQCSLFQARTWHVDRAPVSDCHVTLSHVVVAATVPHVVRVTHSQGLKDLGGEEVFVALARELLDDSARNVEAPIAVAVSSAERGDWA